MTEAVKRKNRELLAKEILKGFRGKITGEGNGGTIVGKNPENLYFVGKIAPREPDESYSPASQVYRGSIGADFYISEEDIKNARITVKPKGEVYYRAYPDWEQQKSALLNRINEPLRKNQRFGSFEEVVAQYNVNLDEFPKITADLVPVYKKLRLEDTGAELNFNLYALINREENPGYAGEDDAQNKNLSVALNNLWREKSPAEYDYDEIEFAGKPFLYEINRGTAVKNLLTEEAYNGFLKNQIAMADKNSPINVNWNIYIEITVRRPEEAGAYLVSASIVNKSQVYSNSKTFKSNSRTDDKYTVETLFNAGMEIFLDGAAFKPIELDYFADDYIYEKTQEAVGSNCAVRYNRSTNSIITENLPLYEQMRLLTSGQPVADVDDLIENPSAALGKIYDEMVKWHEKLCVQIEKEKLQGTPNHLTKAKARDVEEFEREIKRFKFGVDIINKIPSVQDCFVKMNQTFRNTSEKFKSWRLFQIVFIVSQIPDIVACDETYREDWFTEDDLNNVTLEKASLLYYPTGGGKTEAFYGVLIFNLFFDRRRGKNCGVTSMLRYPLRLLSVQQVQRLADVLAQAELIRRSDEDMADSAEFSLGYFVGDSNTPNEVKENDIETKYKTADPKVLDEELIIDKCPFCHEKSVHLKFDHATHRLIHYCENKSCGKDGVLPLYIVDTEIYRYLPSAIISTVDKLAIMGSNSNFRNIFSGASQMCAKHGHGFTDNGFCIVREKYHRELDNNGDEIQSPFIELKEVRMYDPAPTLFIQDELHLIRESLGTYASHYESFIDSYIREVSPAGRTAKVIGATATISSHEDHVKQLYNKTPILFPCKSTDLKRNFYSYTDDDDTQRLILGYAPYGQTDLAAVTQSLRYMREVVEEYLKNPQKVMEIPGVLLPEGEPDKAIREVKEMLKDYWIFLQYNNVKRDGNRVKGKIEGGVNLSLQDAGLTSFKIRDMTGDSTFQNVREVLSQVETAKTDEDVFDGLNLITATSMISHGVDADRFNIMFFYGMPGNTAEYIQAYSRTGRRYTGIVIDILRPARETDQSYLKNFNNYHKYKDKLVEPVPINRWATKAVENTLPGIFAGLILTKYDRMYQYGVGQLKYMSNLIDAVKRGMLKEEAIAAELKKIYKCETSSAKHALGSQYAAKINKFTKDIFERLKKHEPGDNEHIVTGFTRMGYRIMRSLRDTDTQLVIELEERKR